MAQKVTPEDSPIWTHPRVKLPDSGPKAAGILPDALAPASRPVTRNGVAGTNTRTIERPAQGHTEIEAPPPTGSPESRTYTSRSVPR